MKKYLAMLLALAMCFAVFAGCGNSVPSVEKEVSAASIEAENPEQSQDPEQSEASASEQETSTNSAETSASEVPAASIEYPLEGDVTLTWWHTLDPSVTSNIDVATYGDLEIFTAVEAATGVHIENVIVSQQAETETFNLMTASDEMSDIVDGFVSKYPGGGAKALSDGLVIDLMDYAEYMPDYLNVIASREELAKDVYSDNGTMPNFFILRETPTTPASGLTYRKDWLETLGLDVPSTYEEFENVLYAFKSNYDTSKTLYLTKTGAFENNVLAAGYDVAVFLNATGNNTVEPYYQIDGKVKFGLMEDGFVEYIKMMNKWYSDGLISSDFVTADGNPNDEAFISAASNGDTGVWVAPAMVMGNLETSGTDEGYALIGGRDISVNPNDTFALGYEISYVNEKGVSITSSCDHPDIAASWVNFFYTDEGKMFKNWGIEGVSYTMENGEPVYTDLITDNPDGYTQQTAINLYTIYMSGLYEDNLAATYTDTMKAALDAWTTNKVCNYNMPAYMTMTVEESETYASTWSDIGTYCTESILKFIIGSMNIDTDYDAFCDNLISMGIEDCIALKQAALNRYNNR